MISLVSLCPVKRKITVGILLGMAVFLIAPVGAENAPLPEWPPEILDLFATLPVQEGGRVKPLDTVARFTLLRFNGKRILDINPEAKVSPLVRIMQRLRGQSGPPTSRSALEWFLDCLFYPEVAAHHRCFSVESSEVVVALGLAPHGPKRDRYSYAELSPGLGRLMPLAREASDRAVEDRTYLDGHLITLANNVLAYEAVTRFLAFARAEKSIEENSFLSVVFPDKSTVRISEITEAVPGYLTALIEMAAAMDEESRDRIGRALHGLFEELDELATTGRLLALIPPVEPETKVWMPPGEIIEAAFDGEYEGEVPIGILTHFEHLVRAHPGDHAFSLALQDLHDIITTTANARGEYRRVPLEVTYYRGRFLFLSQWLFALAFIVIACTWMLPHSGRITTVFNFSLVPPLVLLATGIVLRSIIRDRPPVTTLYETILFSTFIAALLGFLVEFVNQKRIAMSVGAVMGLVGMFFASKYEAREAVDTMPAVIAVLDTNFWLATHVTTIIIGYGAGLFAAALAHVYVVGRVLGLKRGVPEFYPDLGRVIYGVTAFCLVFTLIGTVVGGVWAAQSWGRFWGWDPKENGALLIVLWALAMMHAKRGGYLRHGGIALSAIVLGMIVVFAWWGVNALGVGLHSYGFISGVWRSLTIFWLVESAVVLLGLLALYRRNELQTD